VINFIHDRNAFFSRQPVGLSKAFQRPVPIPATLPNPTMPSMHLFTHGVDQQSLLAYLLTVN